MTIKYNVSEQDYINFNIDHFYNSKNTKPTMFLFRFMPPILFLVLIFTMNNMSSAVIIISFCIFSAIWIFISPRIMQVSMENTALAYMKSGKANDFIGEQVLKLTEDYIEESNLSMLSQIQYSSIERICFGHGLFYIYIGAIKAIIVPAAAFSSEEQKNTFFNILSQKTGLDFSNIMQLGAF